MNSRSRKRGIKWTFSPTPKKRSENKLEIGTDENINKEMNVPTKKVDKTLFDFWKSPKVWRIEDRISPQSPVPNSPDEEGSRKPDFTSLPEPSSIVADIEDLVVGSSFFTEPEILSKDEIEIEYLSEMGKCIQLVIEGVNSGKTNGLPEVVLNCRSRLGSDQFTIFLRNLWIGCDYNCGASINVSPFTNETTIVVDGSTPYILIYDPDKLIPITTVADGVLCLRKAALTMKIQTNSRENPPTMHMVAGSIAHEVFETGIQNPTSVAGDLSASIRSAIQRDISMVFSCGANEAEIEKHIIDIMETFPKWLARFMGDRPLPDAKVIDELKANLAKLSKQVCIPKVYSLEESITSPTYGLKGKVDAVVLLRFRMNDQEEASLVVPLELKTGKSTNSTAHRAQSLLYTLLLADRYNLSINYGLLFYMTSSTLLRISATRAELQALIMIRNRLAAAAQTNHPLPKPIHNHHQCKQCSQLSNCAIMLKFNHLTSRPSVMLNEVLTARLDDLDDVDDDSFFDRWNTLMTLEEEECKRINFNNATKTIIVALSSCIPSQGSTGFGKFMAEFSLNKSIRSDLDLGDPVSISNLMGDEVGIGFVNSLNSNSIKVNCDRNISQVLVLTNGATYNQDLEPINTIGMEFRLRKYEIMTGFTIGRSNIVQIYNKPYRNLYDLVVNLRQPKFDRKHNNLNISGLDSDQIDSINHCLSTEDYSLVLGMPGTGKTTTLVTLIKLITTSGKRVLVSSHTHSAVDNLLAKVIDSGVKALRIGNLDRIDQKLSKVSLDPGNFPTTIQIRRALEEHLVLGVTCLGANHPILTSLQFDFCIVDEASQITVPSILGPLLLAKKFILVGDHYQLPPLIRSSEAISLGLNVSLFRILAESHPHSVATLSRQYRMCSDIQLIANSTMYHDKLQCGSDVIANASLPADTFNFFCNICGDSPSCWIRLVLSPKLRVVFLDTDNIPAHDEVVGSSFVNQIEARLINILVRSMLTCGITSERLCIISSFRPQTKLLTELLPEDIEISTVDRYQGRDKDCIIFSFVRSNPDRNIGSLLRDWHRLNVAFTRARKKLIMVGSWLTIMLHPQMNVLKGIFEEKRWHIPLPTNGLLHEPI